MASKASRFYPIYDHVGKISADTNRVWSYAWCCELGARHCLWHWLACVSLPLDWRKLKQPKLKGLAALIDNECWPHVTGITLSTEKCTVRWFKQGRWRWAGNVARIEETKSAYEILIRKFRGRRPLERPSVYGRILIKRFLEKLYAKEWNQFSWLRIEYSAGF